MSGILTMEDIIEQLIKEDIEDETDVVGKHVTMTNMLQRPICYND